jgi:hypothetical protein
MRQPGPDKRRTERMEILSEPKGEMTVYQPIALTEIGRGGAKVETAYPLQIDSLHDFRFTLEDRSIVVKGRVVHATVRRVDNQETLYRAGIEFIHPPERVVEAIGEFMDAVNAAHARR